MHSHFPKTFYTEIQQELEAIKSYWVTYSVDTAHGGFLGRRDHYNTIIPQSSKGIILNTRILWSFSAIANFQNSDELLPLMNRSFEYIYSKFRDQNNGGVYWELDALGEPLVKKKQVYAQAFTIYALSEYFIHTKESRAKSWAKEIFDLLEKYAYDSVNEGYIEAFEENWSPIKDMRLSDKDQNAAKTMNTHLHILEAYTSLYRIDASAKIKKALEKLIVLFTDTFLNKDYNFELFFDTDWNLQSEVISFGHDIETLWLLIDAAKAINNQDLLQKTEEIAIPIADRFLELGYLKEGGVINELNRNTNHLDTDRHWWPQAEAMVGLFYAYRISPKTQYQEAILDIWDFTKKHIIDAQNGEWFFRIDENFKPYTSENKLGMWKCPYHNSRACIELLKTHPEKI